MDKNSNLSATRGALADRRFFLKTGALAAAPIAAAAVPAVAFANSGGDDAAARLARLEDERAIETLRRAVLRRINGAGDGGGADRCGEFVAAADAIELDEGLRSITEDQAEDAALTVAEDGATASVRQKCRVEVEIPLTGNTTLERMARLQGHGSHRFSEERVLLTDYVKQDGGWKLAQLRLA